VYDAIAEEKRNKPAVVLVNESFAMDAESAASNQGMPGIRIIPQSVPCECSVPEEIEVGISAAMDDIVAGLTRPLTKEEKSPKPKEVEKTPKIIFRGGLEEVNQFYYKRGWTDGLPIIPPTEESVTEMLTGTELPADHIVGKIIPRSGKATVEKIAINAVMAGALPTAMPLLIAGVEAILDPYSAFGTYGVSTGSWAPFWIVNGPLRHDLNINSGSGALSPGDIANATIGRALGLIIKNIGGIRKGIEDMGVLGNPGKYTLVIAENEEDSPWDPLQVERGFKKGDSTITLFFPQTFNQMLAYGTDARGILSTVVYNANPCQTIGGFNCFIIIPSHAKALAKKGWGKQEIKAFISENTTAPFYRLRQYLYGGRGIIGKDSSLSLALNPMDPIRLIQNPDNVMIIVAGGPGAFMASLHSAGGLPGNSYVTKKIKLPPDWDNLVEKYRDIKPTYIRY